MSTAIIILTLDEIDGVKAIVPGIKKEWAEEIFFVDGGSTDGTIEEAERLGYKVIRQHNKGEGNACRVGVENTKAQNIMFFSPDGNDEVIEIPKLIKKIDEGHSIVHISRFGKNSDSEDAGIIDRFGNNMFTFLVNVFFGGHLTDALNGFRIIKRNVMVELKTDSQYLNIEEQICIKALKKNFKIYEIDGKEPKRIGGERKMKPIKTGAQLSWTIIKEFIFWRG
jgi:glycosyltransferase involved in cell wall biosynthesis